MRVILILFSFLLYLSPVFGQDYDRIEAYSFMILEDGSYTDTVLSSKEYYNDEGKLIKQEEHWWNNGWYSKTSYYDSNENRIRKVLSLGDSAYVVETNFDLDNMGNVINEHISSSKGEKFVMAYSNGYENGKLKEARMKYINLDKEKQDSVQRVGRNMYSYTDDGKLNYMWEEFSGERKIETRYFYNQNGDLRTEHKRDLLKDDEYLINHTYNADHKLTKSVTMHNGEEISNTTYTYKNGRLARAVTQRNNNTYEVVLYFYVQD